MLSQQQRSQARTMLREVASLDDLAAAGSPSSSEARALLHQYLQEKASLGESSVTTTINGNAEIIRDRRGVPHIRANDPESLFFAFGYAQAQDRLWHLDYLRRQAYGELSEIYGPETLASDMLSRTLGIRQIAEGVAANLGPDSSVAIDAFSAGINAWMSSLPAGLPAEFEMLDYEPTPWKPADCIAIQRRWWWYLTGRLNVITTPEAVRAGLGDEARVEQYFRPDGRLTYIVPEGEYDPSQPWSGENGTALTDILTGPIEGVGSNNWVTGPSMSRDGASLLASDPHVYFTVPAEWYEVHLQGAGYDVVGAAYPATPALMYGRNQHLAWGITNNICSLRDLYIEEIDPENPSHYRVDGQWRAFGTRTESIPVRGHDPYQHTTRYAGSRPIVDHLVPERVLPANLWPNDHANSALSLDWIGFEFSDETQAKLDLDRANTVAEAQEAVRNWRCPTFNLVLADDQGSVGYQCVGAIPLRANQRRGYRHAANPADQWQGTIPFDALPRRHNPESDWIATANNPTAPPDFPYPLAGTWAPEDRAGRAEDLLQATQAHTLDTFAAMQADVHSGRAERALPGLLAVLSSSSDGRTLAALAHLQAWDARLTPESVAGAVFYVFYWRWHQRVVRERFAADLIPLVQDAGWGLSSELILEDTVAWFRDDADRVEGMRTAFAEALDWLEGRLGPDLATWEWGKIHRLGAIHPAARTPLQHDLFDLPSLPHPGGASTLASAFYTPVGTFDTKLGANYRLLVSLGPDQEIRSISWPGQSGHPGSTHYNDQVPIYLAQEQVTVPYRWDDVETEAESRITLTSR